MSSTTTPARAPRGTTTYAGSLDAVHEWITELNRTREAELARRFLETNGPGPEHTALVHDSIKAFKRRGGGRKK